VTTPSRFLIVRLGALGDIVHTIPVAAALRRAFPTARIDWLVGARHRAILDLVPVIDRRLVIDDGTDAGGGTSFFASIRELRQTRYDVVLDLQGLLKSAVLARSSGAPRVIGFSSRYLRERLARLFYTEVHDPGGEGMYDTRETRHVMDINLGLLQPLGVTVGEPEFPLERVDSDAAEEMRDQARGPYVLLNPGAAWPNKQWPAARFGALAAALHHRHGVMSIVSWAPGEESLARAVVADASGAALLAPPTSIADLVALASRATVVVAGDTGPTHVAAALGTPVVGLYGPTRPSRNGPLSAGSITISRDAICRCHHLRRCTQARMCLLDIEVDEVLAAVEPLLGRGPRR
jgi:lipopolysaccharide heptosyltransferase I